MYKRYYYFRGTADCPISVYNSTRFLPRTSVHPEVELMLIRSGSVQCRLEDQDLQLNPGDILIINPNQTHTILDFSKELRFINVLFSLDAIAMAKGHIFQQSFVYPLWAGRLQLPNLLQPEHPAYNTVYAALQQLSQGRHYLDDVRFMRYIQIVSICGALQPYCTQPQGSEPLQTPEDRTVLKVMFYLYYHYHQPLTLEKIAAHVHLHPNYLCKLFKAHTGHTVMEYLAQTRVEAATYLLRRDALPMNRVAELSGFPSERSFYRQFRQLTGMTPKAYQKEQIRAYAEYL